MNHLLYFVIAFGMTMHLSQAAEHGNDLTFEEEAAVRAITQQYNIEEPRLDDDSVLITQEMANEFPLSVLHKMLNANETAIAQPQEYPQKEIERLSLEADIFRQSIANHIQ